MSSMMMIVPVVARAVPTASRSGTVGDVDEQRPIARVARDVSGTR